MTLYISTMIPDRTLAESELFNAITKVAKELAKFADQPVQNKTPRVNVAFLLPSSQEKPGFNGLWLHSFEKSSQTLQIDAAVPERMVSSIHAERYVFAVLMDAIDAAGEYFLEELMLFDAPAHLALIESLRPKEQYASN